MSSYEGQIKKVYNNKGRWALLMNDDNWYGLGRKKPVNGKGEEVTDGDFAQFEVEMNGTYRNIVEGTLKTKKGEGAPATGSGGGKGKGGNSYQQKEQFWADKEQRDIDTQKKISFAGALNTAIPIVVNAIQMEYLKLPGGKKASFEAFTAAIEEEAQHIYRTIQSMPEQHESVMSGEEKGQAETLPSDMEPKTEDATPQGDLEPTDDWS